MSGTTNLVRRGVFAFFLGTAGRLPRRWCSTYSPQMEQATSRSGSSSAPRTNAAMATMMPTKMLVPFRMALSDFIVDYRPFTKNKRAASGVRSEHLMQPKVRPLFGGHAGCGLILGSLLSANGRKYLYKKCWQGRHRAQFSAMPSTTGTDYKNNSVCLYSIKIIYEVIIILYLVVVNGGFCMGSCTMITMCLQLYSRRSIIAMRRWSDEKDDLSRLGSHY